MKKIILLLICVMLITAVVPVVESLEKNNSYSISLKNNQTGSRDDWTEMQKLHGGSGNGFFGDCISLDDNTVLIGEPNGENGWGSAYIFTNNGGSWTKQAQFIGDCGPDSGFGDSVSLDGDTALVGAMHADRAYVFTRIGTTWTQQATLIPLESSWHFGSSVSLSGDTALVGARRDDMDGYGAAYVFIRSGTNWIQQQKLIASDGQYEDHFGNCVSISGDIAFIGTDTNSVYIFVRTGNTWTQKQKLLCLGGFGTSISLNGDTAFIGAPNDENNGALTGSVYVFAQDVSTWTQQIKLFASDGTDGDYFGGSISFYDDSVIIGAGGDDDNGVGSGSAYIFTRTETTWIQQSKLLPSDGAPNNFFGDSVSLSGDTAIIGAPFDDDNGVDSGSVYVFKKESENQPFYFLHITDLHITKSNARDVWGKALEQINAMDPLPAFVIITGDIMDTGGKDGFGLFIDPWSSSNKPKLVGSKITFDGDGGWSISSTNIPVYICPGNHDSYTIEMKPNTDFSLYENTLADSYYHKSFSIEDKKIEIFSLNSGTAVDYPDITPKGDGLKNTYGNEVTRFPTDLAASAADIRIILTHNPFNYGNNADMIFINEREMFLDVCNQFNVDLLCCGHTHEGEIDKITGEFLADSNQEYVFTPGGDIHIQLVGDNYWKSSLFGEKNPGQYRKIEVLSDGDIKIYAQQSFTSLSNFNQINNGILDNQHHNQLLHRFLERFPNAFPILRYMMGY